MKNFFLILIMVFVITTVHARDRDQEKQALKELVREREVKFGEYARAAASRSGIFGNKTRKDLQGQVEVLTEIIKTDNRIISTLETFLDYRTFQRTEMTYSQAELDEKYRRLDEITTGLSKKLKDAEGENKNIQLKLKWAKVLNYLLLVAVAVMGYYLWKGRR